MSAEQPAVVKVHWNKITPGRLLAVLLAIEVALFLFEGQLPKGWAVLLAIACAVATILYLLLWFAAAQAYGWRYQFTIRSLLLLTVIVAIPCSWMTLRMDRARRQLRAVEAFDNSSHKRSPREIRDDAYELTPGWLRLVLGDDFFAEVTEIDYGLSFSGKAEDKDLEYLSGIHSLKTLILRETKITDIGLERLKDLRQLTLLNLESTRITDAGLRHLKNLKQLTELDLRGTSITDLGLEQISRLDNLEILNLEGTKVSDTGLRHLERLRKLRRLYLGGTDTTGEGLRRLEKALPDTEIFPI
jgi:hypothetical protein